MADLVITPANVKKRANTVVENIIAGVEITAGQAAYKDTSNKAQLSDNDNAAAVVRALSGLALHGALADQPIALAVGGEVDLGAILTAGIEYYVSGTPGGICPRADVTTGDDVIRVGIALTTSVLLLDKADPNVTL